MTSPLSLKKNQKKGSHYTSSAVAMRLLLTCFTLTQVALAESLTDISGYVGDSVTLPSGADPSWELSSIIWFIFPNATFIVTYTNGRVNHKGFYRYRGRLHLNSSSGDLTIHNLTREDAIQYTVDLLNTRKKNKINTIRLSVKQHLQKPDIDVLFTTSNRDGCWMGLRCNSTDEGVSLSWKMDNHAKTFNSSLDGKSTFVLVHLNKTQQVKFTCTSSRNAEEYTSRNDILTCEEDKPNPTLPPPSRHRGLLFFFGGLTLPIVISLLLWCLRSNFRQLHD